MQLASEQGLRSIAFPAISTGIYGYPREPATNVAVRTVRAMVGAGSSVEEVLFACFSAEEEGLGCIGLTSRISSSTVWQTR